MAVRLIGRSEGGLTDGRAPPQRPVPHDVKTAVDYIREDAGRRISMADLVTHCRVPARILRKHFQSFMGISPIGFWRRLRLGAVRENLLGGAAAISVTDVAACAGFTHFGRFAQQYRLAFGETPSATLHRNRLSKPESLKRDPESLPRFASDTSIPLVRRDRPSLVILPFQLSGAAPECRDFAEYLTEGLAGILCRARSLSVVVSSSPRGGAMSDPKRFARDLVAHYVLTGRVAQSGERVRVVVRLVYATTDVHIWGDIFEGEITNLFALQDRVTESVMRAVLPQIRASEIERARRKLPQDLEACDLTMRALPFVFAASPDAAKKALDLLTRAMELDPTYGPATALVAWCHAQLVLYNATPSPGGEQVRALMLSERAAILEPDDPLVLTARSAVHTMAGQMSPADTLVNRALALDPSFVWAWERSGWLNAYGGRPEIAIGHFEQATRLDPSLPNANRLIGMGCAHFDAGRYEKAVLWKLRGLQSQPTTVWINRTLSVSYARLGDRLAALASVDELRRYSPDLTIREVVGSIPFTQNFLDRVAESLNDLGMPD